MLAGWRAGSGIGCIDGGAGHELGAGKRGRNGVHGCGYMDGVRVRNGVHVWGRGRGWGKLTVPGTRHIKVVSTVKNAVVVPREQPVHIRHN